MSGYAGNSDLEAEHALILAENGVNACSEMLDGPQLDHCTDCGERINPLRVEALKRLNMKCMYCVECQGDHDGVKRVRMLDRIL